MHGVVMQHLVYGTAYCRHAVHHVWITIRLPDCCMDAM